MHLSDTLQTAQKGVTANTKRSLLTMLGIIIGVGSVVLMTGVGKSMEGVILGQISSLGSKSMVIFPGGGPGGEGQLKAGHDSLTFQDYDALQKLDSIQTIAPNMFVPGVVRHGREQATASVIGTLPTFFRNQSIDVADGRLLIPSDIEGAKSVIVIGPDIATELFPAGRALGQSIKVGDRSFTVIGVTESIGSQFFQNADERAYIPLSTARAITGQKYMNYMTLQSRESFALAFDEVKYLLRRRHGIINPEDDPDKDDFVVRSSAQANQILGTVSISLTVFITFIAGISLVVGGIGIMNIMLVAVSERTREIGLRKAVGARRRDILFQFLIEAILLTFIGGMIGMVCGVVVAYLSAAIVNRFLSTYIFALSPGAMVASLFVAAGTGLIFGIYPAKKASELRPIQALRYE